MKKYLKVLVIALLLILAEIFIYSFVYGKPGYFREQCVMGIDGDSNGNFAVCLSLSNAMDFDVFFFNSQGEFVNKTSVKIRGGSVQVKNYNEYLVVQSYPISYFFNYNGERISNLSYCEKEFYKSSYSYEWNGISVEYSRDPSGNEIITYHNGGEARTLDVDYNTYKQRFTASLDGVFIALNYGLFLGLHLLKKRIKNMGKFEHAELKDK